ncbi:60S ribosomal protein L33B [Blastocladiella emersonii ATCC 22665]|nr:60S ribosomal protein L33B [Blastocladiella emersonii ATCC 22665]
MANTPVRLYSKARILGYKRSLRNQQTNQVLLRVEGVHNKEDTDFYLGKRVAYVYKAERAINGSKIRVMWGRISRPHGNSGVVKVIFKNSVPPKSFGARARVMLYPSRV